MNGRVAIALIAVGLSLTTVACGGDDAPDGTARSVAFEPDVVLARNATPTPTVPASPTPTPTTTPVPTLTPTPTPTPTATPPWPSPGEVETLLDSLLDEGERRDPNVDASIAVSYGGNIVEASNGLDQFPSASLAKAWWVAVAVDHVGISAVRPYAEPIFALSDNDSAAAVIDLVDIDTINETTTEWGMRDTFLASWTLDTKQRLSQRFEPGAANVTTTRDAVTFMGDLADGLLLSPEQTETVLEWMTVSPDRRDIDPFGSVLVADLPVKIATSSAHKAGWLPPECCEAGPADHEVIASAGIIPCRPLMFGRSDRSFSVAVAAIDGADYAAGLEWLSESVASIATKLCPDLKSWDGDDGNGDQQRHQ